MEIIVSYIGFWPQTQGTILSYLDKNNNLRSTFDVLQFKKVKLNRNK